MPDQTPPPGPPDESLVLSLGADPELRVSREWIGVLLESGKQNRLWNGFWLAACLGVTVVLAVTHAHPVAFVVPILALLVAILTETRRPPNETGFAITASDPAGSPGPVLAAALDDA